MKSDGARSEDTGGRRGLGCRGKRQKGKDRKAAGPGRGLSNRLYPQSGAGGMFSLPGDGSREQAGKAPGGGGAGRRNGRQETSAKSGGGGGVAGGGGQNVRDPASEGTASDWNPKDNLWENAAHDSSLGNTEATNASARHQGAPGERKGK